MSVPSGICPKPKNMKEIKTFIGVDISKATLDICLLDQQAQHFQIANESKAIRKFIAQFKDCQNEVLHRHGKYGTIQHRTVI